MSAIEARKADENQCNCRQIRVFLRAKFRKQRPADFSGFPRRATFTAHLCTKLARVPAFRSA
jgi:hypothetical protein